MNKELRRAMLNAVKLVTRLEPREKFSREDLIDALRQPLPDVDENEATLRHAYRHYILRGGIDNADAVITYEEAAKIFWQYSGCPESSCVQGTACEARDNETLRVTVGIDVVSH